MRKEAKCIRTIDIIEANATGDSLRLGFGHLFLRKPNKGEADIVFSTEDLEGLAAYVWCGSPLRFALYEKMVSQTQLILAPNRSEC